MCVRGYLPSTASDVYESIVCILIPLTSEQLRIYEWATLTLTGGSKGQMALGDAHPYLAPFDLENYIIICDVSGLLRRLSLPRKDTSI